MITNLRLKNFKSIQDQAIELRPLNLLIGPNGSGKSNFISAFRFLEQLIEQRLQEYIFSRGGINDFLYNGFEESRFIELYIELAASPSSSDCNVYTVRLTTDGEAFAIQHEAVGYWQKTYTRPYWNSLTEKAVDEAKLKSVVHQGPEDRKARYVYRYLSDLRLFHFHDTSENARVKLPQAIDDVYFYHSEAENLAPLLLHFQENYFHFYQKIVEVVRLIYPPFQDFVLEESPRARGKVVLRWREKQSQQIFSARQISDGTLRFICLAFLLIQPPDTPFVPSTIILDEPELGLHPSALRILSELVQEAALHKQIIIATQSVGLINYFQPEDLLVADRYRNGTSVFKRLKDEDYRQWLEDYSLGQLWESNFFGGRP